LEVCARSGVRVLAFEPGRTILLDRPEAEALAVKSGISLVAIGEPA
jgi:DUF1009 family protein